ncbi:hypothetical protein BDQ12DRAFT_727456 [Crucibulum laeve]|uniref:Bromo domain-containing protein n=1 Tax=Crucibulum laeve TaxID=68775 RepID=A0A5C3LL28_9AGAR|nr:hypothetical protein BDQ12DRAFT_727456 [Crucibulum laeve]
MNNLLRTLTESQVKPAADLKLLLTTVKEGRRQSYDAKLSDPFYDSLEGLLVDLKTITIDNRDAEAFLKPVSKAEVPDYYEVIANPMDFQTMLKKVKQKQYKSKREFQDDLELIWSNCFTYNATENHPLRQCVKRLKAKADRLLKYITDRKDRTDPSIPTELPAATGIARPKLNGVNGFVNGRSHTRSPSYPLAKSMSNTTIKPSVPLPTRRLSRRDLPFPETPAITRTPAGMSTFLQLDKELQDTAGPSQQLVDRLREMVPPIEYESESETDKSHTPDDSAMAVDGVVGDKRKLNGIGDHRPKKRTQFTMQYPIPLASERDDVSQLWWGAVQSDSLLANGIPNIPFASSSSLASFSSATPLSPPRKPRPKRRKKPTPPKGPPKGLLTIMNNNIKTMKRVRHTHAKFAALAASNAPNEEGEGGEGAFGGGPPTAVPTAGVGTFGAVDEELDDRVDERSWLDGMPKGKGKARVRGGIEMGEKNAGECVRWVNMKILEHSGFQGTSSAALDVLCGVTSEYLLNVGRMMRFMSDTYSNTMTPEEIILHTLFESGSSKIQDMERYIRDDVERYGSRLGELEKKLAGAYRESTAGEVLEDEGLFESEDEEETGALAMGDFADMVGEDYLGLRELGIAAEFGLSNLSIPKKLLKGKKGQNKPIATKPTEPPPPYPPPPPFIPLNSTKIDDQIGLLKTYYQSRFSALSAANAAAPPPPPLPPLPGPSFTMPRPPNLPGPSMPYGMHPPPLQGPSIPNGILQTPAPIPAASSTVHPPPPPAILTLPDDTPHLPQTKMGPLGQIVRGVNVGATKKKAKVDAPPPTSSTAAVVITPAPSTSGEAASPKKKKGNTGVGTGNGRKKKPGDGQGGNEFGPPGQVNEQGQGGSPFPPVVTATA